MVLAKRPPTGSPSLGREEPADLCRHQGSPGDASPYRLPHDDRSPYGFTPARPRVGHPHVATRTPAVTGKMSPAATCGRGTSLARGSARLGSARPRPGHDQWPWAAVRAAPLRATRMARRSAAPRVPSTHPSSRRCAEAHRGARGGGSAGGFPRFGEACPRDTFFAGASGDLTGSAGLSARPSRFFPGVCRGAGFAGGELRAAEAT